MKKIYMDNAATSFPKAKGVGDAVKEFLDLCPFNIGRGGYDSAYEVTAMVGETRERIQKLFHGNERYHLCFTGGATQAINQFLKGILKPGDHIIVSSMEHNAVMRPLYVLGRRGISYSIAPCDKEGKLNPEDVIRLMRANTKAVLCCHASNVCGTILPVAEIGAICAENHIWFAVDAAQTAGIYPIDLECMHIDFMAFPGHKGLRGPQGVGGFLVKDTLAEQLLPLMEGGTGSMSAMEQQPEFLPDKFESGTLPLPAIMGLRQALEQLEKEDIKDNFEKEAHLTELFLKSLESIPQIRIAGIKEPERCAERVGIISIDFLTMDNGMAAFQLEQEYGIMVRSGLQCAPNAHKTLGTYPQGTVRFSLNSSHTEQEIQMCVNAIRSIV